MNSTRRLQSLEKRLRKSIARRDAALKEGRLDSAALLSRTVDSTREKMHRLSEKTAGRKRARRR